MTKEISDEEVEEIEEVSDKDSVCENMDQSFTIDSESDAEHSEEETDDEEHDSSCDVNQSNFIVFWSCLTPLFRFCSICFKPASIEKILVKGTLLIVHILCVASKRNDACSKN